MIYQNIYITIMIFQVTTYSQFKFSHNW